MEKAPIHRPVGDSITIRRACSVTEYRACQEAQRRAWGISEDGYVLPVATMVGANLHGGLVLGAFLNDGQAVAMSFGFLGRVGRRLCLYSQLTGVVPGYQSKGLGHELKLAQRDFAQGEGLDLIVWAFDPLQAGNARFNLEKLGARVRRYVDNMYGQRTDAINAGVPTDRLIAEWEIGLTARPPAANNSSQINALPRIIQTGEGPAGEHLPLSVNSGLDSPRLLLEIPAGIAALRRDQPELAEWWRAAVRQGFCQAFEAGYQAIGFIRDDRSGRGRCFYVLERAGTQV